MEVETSQQRGDAIRSWFAIVIDTSTTRVNMLHLIGLRSMTDEDGIDRSDEYLFFRIKATWHVTHADGTQEKIVLQHGNFLENNVGTVGQVLFDWDHGK